MLVDFIRDRGRGGALIHNKRSLSISYIMQWPISYLHTFIMMIQTHVLQVYLQQGKSINNLQSLEPLLRYILTMIYVIWNSEKWGN